jgi:hypothetical protein
LLATSSAGRSYFTPTSPQVDFDLVRGARRIGVKYEIEHLRDDACAVLSRDLRKARWYGEYLPAELALAFDIARLLHEQHLTRFLYAAHLHCARYPPHELSRVRGRLAGVPAPARDVRRAARARAPARRASRALSGAARRWRAGRLRQKGVPHRAGERADGAARALSVGADVQSIPAARCLFH